MMWSTKAKLSQKLTEVNDSKSTGLFDVVSKSDAHHSLIEWPIGRVIGLEKKYDELCKCFEMDEVDVIGIYGLGGVGKTILLKKFYNEFLPTTHYDVVLWVEGVSTKEGDVAKIQEIIKNKLNIIDDSWKEYTDEFKKACTLYSILKEKKFVLILDGVGVPIDLVELGIPLPNQNESKVILTTRDEDICHQMRADKYFRVGILSDEQAFELFKETVGEKVISSNKVIEKLAKSMSVECKGLPLAVIVVGKSMRNVTSFSKWQVASKLLKRYPSRFPRMVEDVYRVLEYSYDRLLDNTLKSCFLYCSLFPENHNIKIHELIQLWTAEGYFRYSGDVYEAQTEGRIVIRRLKRAGLLEDGEAPSELKMHDVIRDVAWWIACEHGSLVRFKVKDNAMKNPSEMWEEVEKLSLWGNACGIVPKNAFDESRCPNLVTLLMRGILEEDFKEWKLPNTIKVLDMPDNRLLGSLPSTVGRLVDLEYLNFSNSLIVKLPEELKELKKLRYLLLNDIAHLEIPRGVLRYLSSLRAISMLHSSRAHCDDNIIFSELETLMNLHAIRISIDSYPSFEKILVSQKLRRRICTLDAACVFAKSSLQTFATSLGKMLHLEELMICDKISLTDSSEAENENCLNGFFRKIEYQIPLCRLTITKWKVFDLDWLKFAPMLQYLKLDQCDLLEEIITQEFWVADDVERFVFACLTTLILTDLPSLRSICDREVKFPSLEEIIVRGCPKLRKLPFNGSSQLNCLKSFQGNQGWVDRLKWDDEVTKNFFLQKFEADEVLVEAGGSRIK